MVLSDGVVFVRRFHNVRRFYGIIVLIRRFDSDIVFVRRFHSVVVFVRRFHGVIVFVRWFHGVVFVRRFLVLSLWEDSWCCCLCLTWQLTCVLSPQADGCVPGVQGGRVLCSHRSVCQQPEGQPWEVCRHHPHLWTSADVQASLSPDCAQPFQGSGGTFHWH